MIMSICVYLGALAIGRWLLGVSGCTLIIIKYYESRILWFKQPVDLGGNWPWALVGSSFRKGSRKIGIASPHCISLAYINRPPHPPWENILRLGIMQNGLNTCQSLLVIWSRRSFIFSYFPQKKNFGKFCGASRAKKKTKKNKKSGHLDMVLLQIQISDLSESVWAERRGKRGKEVFLLLFLSDSRIRHLKRFPKKNKKKKSSTP